MAAKAGQNDALALAFARGRTAAEAAREAGVSERTARRRLADADFRQRVSELRGELLDSATGELASGASAAAKTLVVLLLDEATPPAVKLSAARATIELACRLRESNELEQRLADLERRLAEQNGEPEIKIGAA